MLAADFDLGGARVFVAGDRGMAGGAVLRALRSRGCKVLTAPHPGVDLRRADAVGAWMASARPDAVVVAAAARLGGILANATRPGELLYDNLAVACAVVEAARVAGVAKLVYLGSSCVYPRAARQPIVEDALLAGPLEPTSQWYAVAKIAGVKLCQAYRRQYGCEFVSIVPCNLYGPYDNFDPASGHVIPALLRRMHEAKRDRRATVAVWGTGRPLREFLHVDDFACAAVRLLEADAGSDVVNVGSGAEVSIAALAEIIRGVVGYQGRIVFDPASPDGVPRKLLDSSRMAALGWRARIPLPAGLRSTYRWYCARGGDAGRY